MLEPRPITPEDTPGVHALIQRIFDDYDYVLDVENEDPHLKEPGPYFRAGGGQFWVIEHAGEIIATCAVFLREDAGELKSLYVDHRQRRQGLARMLTRKVIEHVRATGRRCVMLWSDTRFVEAHKLYESLGFTRGGQREIHATNDFAEYRYDLPLG